MTDNSVFQEPESFIVQNVTLGPLHISDIRMNFAPLQAIDLTWEDPKVIKASKDLRSCLRIGYLKKISPEQFETIEEKHAIRERKELLRQQSEQKLETVDVDGREMTAENIDALRGYNKESSVSTAGYANDSLSYAIALDVAQTQAQLLRHLGQRPQALLARGVPVGGDGLDKGRQQQLAIAEQEHVKKGRQGLGVGREHGPAAKHDRIGLAPLLRPDRDALLL